MADRSKKLTVALVRGPIIYGDKALNSEATPAIAFAYISAYLRKQGYATVLVDAVGEGINQIWKPAKYPGYRCQGLTFEEITARIPAHTGVIGFSGMFSGEWPLLRDLINFVRKCFPKALFVAGGEHITALTEYSLKDCPALDVCVRGEGERTFQAILEANEEENDFSAIIGAAYIDHEGIYRQNGAVAPRISVLNDIPWPFWPDGYLEKFWSAGKSYGVATERDMPFMISRGCPYRCAFCSSPQMWTTRYVVRSVDNVIEEIKYYIAKYGITSVQLYDLTAILKKSWVMEFCRRLIGENIKLRWSLPSGTRSEALDQEAIGLLKATGCNYLVYAPESGSQHTLALVRKQIHLREITRSILEAKRQGLTVRANLIIGFPGEAWKEMIKTLLYGLKLSLKGVDEVPLFIFSPYPGTEIFKALLESGKITVNDQYFFSLNSLNSAYFSLKVISYNPDFDPRLLGIIRVFFILANYFVGYLLYPRRILRTLRNIFSNREAATVIEHRLKDLIGRTLRRKKPGPSPRQPLKTKYFRPA